jgi:hypothetical protein
MSAKRIIFFCAVCALGMALFTTLYYYKYGVSLPQNCLMVGEAEQLPTARYRRGVEQAITVRACVTKSGGEVGELSVLLLNRTRHILAIEDMRCLTDTRLTGIPRPPYEIGAPNSVCIPTPVGPYEAVRIDMPILLHTAYKPETLVRDLIAGDTYLLRLVNVK